MHMQAEPIDAKCFAAEVPDRRPQTAAPRASEARAALSKPIIAIATAAPHRFVREARKFQPLGNVRLTLLNRSLADACHLASKPKVSVNTVKFEIGFAFHRTTLLRLTISVLPRSP
jgi:hypothetical protein